MENVKIISDNGVEINVNGLFYIFNSKYYFIYTTGETDENQYIKLYVVQVCKEIQKTPNGPVDTGFMLGMEISNADEWKQVQQSITKIVEDKKNGTQNPEIQYLPMTMLVNLKIVSKNKFKLMKHIVEDDFKVVLPPVEDTPNVSIDNTIFQEVQPIEPFAPVDPVVPIASSMPVESIQSESQVQPITPIQPVDNSENVGEVIIDYRARFFEEQEKNQALEEEIRILKEKLENVKNIIDNS